MIHHHFKQINSTQTFLLADSRASEKNQILISCETQLKGIGQYKRHWDSFDESLCLSFTASANEIPSLSSLEIGALVANYFKLNYETDLFLKWPNDILNEKKQKVGGIILSYNSKFITVGVGLNFFKATIRDEINYETPYGHIFKDSFKLNKKDEALRVFNFVNQKRMSAHQTKNEWRQKCIHLNSSVLLKDSREDLKVIFMDIGDQGEAIIQDENNKIKKYFSASIRI